jgi:hypothetical protein
MGKILKVSTLMAVLCATWASPVAAEGLEVPGSASPWAARLELGSYGGSRWGDVARGLSIRMYSDYYLGGPQLGDAGGLRLTSGLLVGQRSVVLGALATSRQAAGGLALGQTGPVTLGEGNDGLRAWPYVGVGYTGISLRGGWGFTADLGLAAQNLGAAVRLGSSPGLDEVLRDLRLQPLLQLGVSYRF